MRFRFAALLSLLLTLSLAAPAAADPGTGLDPAPDQAVAQLETEFLRMMIPHHREAIAMARMAEMKASRPELRALASKMIRDQQNEIVELGHWLRDWYGQEPPSGATMPMDMMRQMGMPMMPDMAERMRAMETKTGSDFDVAFMSAMVDHHAMAVMMAAPVLMHGHHADLYKAANTIVLSQGEEIRQMREWLRDWYGVPRPV